MNYLCVDALNMLHRYHHGLPVMVSPKLGEGNQVQSLVGWCNMLLTIHVNFKAKFPVTPVIFFDSKLEKKEEVENLGVEYKGNRERSDNFHHLVTMAIHLTRLMGIRWVIEDGVEADETIGKFVLSQEFESCVVVSSDKDLLQLVDDSRNVSCLVLRNSDQIVMDEAAVMKRWGVKPNQVADLLIMMGDKSDNIPGLPGIGIKGAQRVLQEFGSLENAIGKAQGKTGRILSESSDKIRVFRDLIELKNGPVEVRHQKKDLPKAIDLANKIGMPSIVAKMAKGLDESPFR